MPDGLGMDDLLATDEQAIGETARLLVDAFRGHSPSWPDIETALITVRKSFGDGRLSRIARESDGRVVGWIGAIRQYSGHVWEIHPVAVLPECQGTGVGRMLLQDIERNVSERGGATLWLGTDDEDGRTSLSGIDPYPDPLRALSTIRNVGGHPFEFYQKCGFVLVGMLPDANGYGKPDIFMAKRIPASH